MKLIQKLSVLTFFITSAASAGSLPDLIALQDWIALQEAQNIALNIDWKVGDQLTYQISVNGMGQVGTAVREVTQDTGDTLWIKNEITAMTQKETIDMEIRKADGQVVKVRRNGQDQEIPNQDIEIVSSEEETVTVPAGTFQSVHIVAKTKEIQNVEVWLNPRDTALEGTIKQVIPTQLGRVTAELTSFKKN